MKFGRQYCDERAKIIPRRKRQMARLKTTSNPPRLAFLAWGDFHVRLRFARSAIPEEKWGLLVV